MRVNEVMTPEVKLVSPDATIKDAALLMAELDIGVLPVANDERLIGVITDRDIALRAVGKGLPASTQVKEVMSREVLYCFDDEDVEDVAENMASIQVRRLPVVSREKRLVGIISIGDIALMSDAECAGDAVRGISEPGGQHSQSGDGASAGG